MPSNLALERVKRELSSFKDPDITITPMNDNIMKLEGTIRGPPDTPYTDGIYRLMIDVPDSYPFTPPQVKFITKIWHPNISSVTGVICLDILGEQWAAAMSIRTILLSIQLLMSCPEPDNPQDAVVAEQYKRSPDIWKNTAIFWCNFFANGHHSVPSYTELLHKMMSMGYHELTCVTALSQSNWDIPKALDSL
ncbi:hypothetical protein SNEBB_006264 [Seison nebaliae]|nr:hypothetical protein SNEBB_006264 [Seison nebaliae]